MSGVSRKQLDSHIWFYIQSVKTCCVGWNIYSKNPALNIHVIGRKWTSWDPWESHGDSRGFWLYSENHGFTPYMISPSTILVNQMVPDISGWAFTQYLTKMVLVHRFRNLIRRSRKSTKSMVKKEGIRFFFSFNVGIVFYGHN